MPDSGYLALHAGARNLKVCRASRSSRLKKSLKHTEVPVPRSLMQGGVSILVTRIDWRVTSKQLHNLQCERTSGM